MDILLRARRRSEPQAAQSYESPEIVGNCRRAEDDIAIRE
jgi:hypothetical protein